MYTRHLSTLTLISAKGIAPSKFNRFSGCNEWGEKGTAKTHSSHISSLIVYQLPKPTTGLMSFPSSTRKGPSYTWCEAYKNNQSYCYALVNEWRSMHRVVSRVVPLIDALDAIYMEKGDAEA